MLTSICTIAELGEGETHASFVDGVEVLVCNIQGEYFAVHGQCSHARQSLATGRVRGYEISCPLHGHVLIFARVLVRLRLRKDR